jgi:hypothetical protein
VLSMNVALVMCHACVNGCMAGVKSCQSRHTQVMPCFSKTWPCNIPTQSYIQTTEVKHMPNVSQVERVTHEHVAGASLQHNNHK